MFDVSSALMLNLRHSFSHAHKIKYCWPIPCNSIEDNSTVDALHLTRIYSCKLVELVAKEKRVLEMVGNFRDQYNFSNGVKKFQNFK